MSKKKEILFCYENGGICRYEYPEINGIKQYIQIRGVRKDAPLLLFLHGGPGGSMAGLAHVIQNEWEKHFTVVNWDQRNTCKTLIANKKRAGEIAETGSLADFMADIDAVIQYLHTVYSFKKLILAGFSWGSLIGAEYAKLHPENISHYIGIGQHVHYFEGLDYSISWMKDLAKDDATDMAQLNTFSELVSKRPAMDDAFLKAIQGFSVLGAKYIAKDARPFPVKELLKSPFLKLKEKKAMITANAKLLAGTYRTLLAHDFRENLHFDVPVLFLFGDEDFACPEELLNRCYDQITAPVKEKKTLAKATHLCFFDQPEAFLKEVLAFTE